MTGAANTLFLRLEGPLQAWGDDSKLVIRRTQEAPTKSGIVGLLCAAQGISRVTAIARLEELNGLAFAIRIDRPGVRTWDYHTAGAGYGLRKAEGGIKRTATTGEIEPVVSKREYLADASFLAVLQGTPELIEELHTSLRAPVWPPYLGRKSCPPSVPILAAPHRGEDWSNPGSYPDLMRALSAVPWRPRRATLDREPEQLVCLMDWISSEQSPRPPDDVETWYDTVASFDPPSYYPRLVLRTSVKAPRGRPTLSATPAPPRPQADYTNSQYREVRKRRLAADHGLCVLCKSPADTVQHVTYRRAGGHETMEDLRALCRLCHDAVTMIEYGLGLGLDRIDPEDPSWRDQILAKRDEIVRFRSLENRRHDLKQEAR